MVATTLLDGVIGLGGNLGDPVAAFIVAVRRLQQCGRIAAVSPLYRSHPVGPPEQMRAQPDFQNAAVRIEYPGEPLSLLQQLQEIEHSQGRERHERWGPRTLDLDVLWIANLALDSQRLTVPHCRLAERAFALMPLLSVAPTASDPRSGQPYLEKLLALGPSLGAGGLEATNDARWEALTAELAGR